ncbi:hypothetical protein JW905_13350 [bacterium]|nr:hypothetical protein [candidate division CSSED10-310 bacterium]
MTGVLQFIGYVIGCLGGISALFSLLYFIYRKARKRSYQASLSRLFEHALRTFQKFRGAILKDDLSGAEFFFLNELKRLKINVPIIFPNLRERFARVFTFALRKHKSKISEADDQCLNGSIRVEVLRTLEGEYNDQMNRLVFRHILLLVPPVVGGATFFPLLFYLKYYSLLLIPTLAWYVAGGALLAAAVGLFVLANR